MDKLARQTALAPSSHFCSVILWGVRLNHFQTDRKNGGRKRKKSTERSREIFKKLALIYLTQEHK